MTPENANFVWGFRGVQIVRILQANCPNAAFLRRLLYYWCVIGDDDYVTSLRISIVQYLNISSLVRGFTHGSTSREIRIVPYGTFAMCRSASHRQSGYCDHSPQVIELQRIDNLVVLPNLSIASKKSVRSLLFISKKLSFLLMMKYAFPLSREKLLYEGPPLFCSPVHSPLQIAV